MKHVVRLLFALIIGLVAAVLNWLWMSSERDYPQYVYVTEPIMAGERITGDKLEAIPVKGDKATLGKILVPWSQKELWFERFAARDYSPNQPLLQRDMTETTTARDWDTLGPFTLVGVGNEPTAAFNGEAGQVIPVSGNILTLAIDDSQRSEKGLLYRYLAAMRGEFYFNETAAERSLLKIIGVEPVLSRQRNTAADRDGAGQPEFNPARPFPQEASNNRSTELAGQRLIFVSLENVPNAPTWLRIGEEIYFMVPPGKQKFLTQGPLESTDQRQPASQN